MNPMNNSIGREGALEYLDGNRPCYLSARPVRPRGRRRCKLLAHVAYVVPSGDRFKIEKIVSIDYSVFRQFKPTGARFVVHGQELIRYESSATS